MAKSPTNLPKKPPATHQEEIPDALAGEIARRIDSLVPAAAKTQVVAQVMSLVYEERFSGPIPHPRHLREYEESSAGSANRLIAMAESALSHNQDMQRLQLTAEISNLREGRYIGVGVLIVLVAAAIFFGVIGNNIMGALCLGTSALGTIGEIMRGGRTNKQGD